MTDRVDSHIQSIPALQRKCQSDYEDKYKSKLDSYYLQTLLKLQRDQTEEYKNLLRDLAAKTISHTRQLRKERDDYKHQLEETKAELHSAQETLTTLNEASGIQKQKIEMLETENAKLRRALESAVSPSKDSDLDENVVPVSRNQTTPETVSLVENDDSASLSEYLSDPDDKPYEPEVGFAKKTKFQAFHANVPRRYTTRTRTAKDQARDPAVPSGKLPPKAPAARRTKKPPCPSRLVADPLATKMNRVLQAAEGSKDPQNKEVLPFVLHLPPCTEDRGHSISKRKRTILSASSNSTDIIFSENT